MPLKLSVLGLLSAIVFALVACNNSSSSAPRPGAGTGAVQPAPVIVTPEGEMIVSTPAANYPGKEFDPYVALNEFGTWQQIGPQKYFIPRGVQANWQPYQNGYWSFDEERGWSFVSADKWGWITEHNGLWRHHAQHGWVWFPFPDHRQYEPSVVTWFNQDIYVGWYPYSQDVRFREYYKPGLALGFNDGFWAGGYLPVVNLAFATPGFNMGIVLVDRANVTQPNIRRFLITDRNTIQRIAIAAHSEERIRDGFVGPHPGGSREKSLNFIQQHATVQAPMGRATTVKSKGGAMITQPFIPAGGHPGRQTAEKQLPQQQSSPQRQQQPSQQQQQPRQQKQLDQSQERQQQPRQLRPKVAQQELKQPEVIPAKPADVKPADAKPVDAKAEDKPSEQKSDSVQFKRVTPKNRPVN